ncbi:MAG: GntR family transcriptional regulator [Planctomycetaceae bacterium]|nr:GntR family transcriptional regulator [Planctomycetaceae bacterium]
MKSFKSRQSGEGADRSLLRERAYRELKSRILGGQFERTPFLSTRGLATELGMSLSPVRSAVERLENEGLLSIGPQRGIVVTNLTTSEIMDHFEVRQALETLVVGKLARKISPGEVEQLRSNVAAYEKHLRKHQIEAFITCDSEFHLLLAEFAGNADIERVLRQLRDRIFRIVLRVIERVPQRMQASVDEHRHIVDLLEQGEGEHVALEMAEHLRRGLKTLVPGIVKDEWES